MRILPHNSVIRPTPIISHLIPSGGFIHKNKIVDRLHSFSLTTINASLPTLIIPSWGNHVGNFYLSSICRYGWPVIMTGLSDLVIFISSGSNCMSIGRSSDEIQNSNVVLHPFSKPHFLIRYVKSKNLCQAAV